MLEDCYVGCDKCFSLDTERVTTMVLQAVSLRFYVPSENSVTPFVILFYKFERNSCIAIVTAIMLALHRSLIKTESRTAKLRQVDSHCQGFTGK